MAAHVVASEGEIGEGERLTVQLEGREVTVLRLDGEYHAYTNWCAHQSGPVCEGVLTGTAVAELDEATGELDVEWVREGKILSCPWHGWEYDAETGECLSKAGVRLPPHPVAVEDGEVVVEI